MADDKKDPDYDLEFHKNKHGVSVHNTIEESGENIRTIFCYSDSPDIDYLIEHAEEKSIKVKSIESETDEWQRFSDVKNVYEIYSDKGTSVVGSSYEDGVVIIRGPKDDALFEELDGRGSGVVNHGKEEFSIMGDIYCPTCNQEIKERTEIIAKCNTVDLAEYRDGAELLPGTDYDFYLDKKLIGKFTMGYKNSEMNNTQPIIEDFEVENESYKETIVQGIEERLEKQGFPGIWITNYTEYPPETDFWCKMGYEFDIDEGHKEFW